MENKTIEMVVKDLLLADNRKKKKKKKKWTVVKADIDCLLKRNIVGWMQSILDDESFCKYCKYRRRVAVFIFHNKIHINLLICLVLWVSMTATLQRS